MESLRKRSGLFGRTRVAPADWTGFSGQLSYIPVCEWLFWTLQQPWCGVGLKCGLFAVHLQSFYSFSGPKIVEKELLHLEALAWHISDCPEHLG